MTFNDIFAKILRWGIFISLFLPLIIFTQYLSPFHFGKMIIFRILVELMVVLYIPLMVTDKKYRPKKNLILISVSIFAFLYFFSGLIGNNFYVSFWGTIERMGGIFSFLHFWTYFIILISIIKSEVDWHKVLKISVVVGFLSILFAYGQHFIKGDFFVGWQHGERVIGTIGNPSLFAGYLLFILFLAIFFVLKKDVSAWQKGFFAAVAILGVPVLLLTASRGAIVSFWATLFLLIVFFVFVSANKTVKRTLSIIILIFVVLLIGFWLSRDQGWVKKIGWLQRLSDISTKTETIQTRLWSWESALKGFKEKPIFGWGPENFVYLHTKYFDARHFTNLGAETIWDRAHNIILEMLSTMGIVGLLSYAFIFFSVLSFLIKRFKEKKIAAADFGVIVATLIAYVGQNLFIFDTFANYLLFFLVLGYIYYLSCEDAVSIKAKNEPAAAKDFSFLLTAVLLIIALIIIFQYNIKPAKANYACTRAILAGQNGKASEAAQYYKKALNYDSAQINYDIRHKFAAFAIKVIENQKQKGVNIDTVLLHYAIDEVKKNIEKFPMDTTPYLYVGRMYILLINEEPEAGNMAETYINGALALNKKNPRIWYELGQAQLSLGKKENAYNTFKEALNLNPAVNVSYWFLAMAAFETGESNLSRYQEAVELAEKAIALHYDYKNSINDLMRLVPIYEKVKNYPKVVETLKYAAIEKPDSAQIRASLAAAYAKIGDYENAKKEALNAVEIDPNFKTDAEKFINSLPH